MFSFFLYILNYICSYEYINKFNNNFKNKNNMIIKLLLKME